MANFKNLWSKGWLRVPTEALAIVASILIAFAIDAWWEERSEQVWQNELLVALYQEFAANQDPLIEVSEVGRKVVAQLQELRAQLKAAEYGATVEVNALNLAALMVWRTSDIGTGALDALLASGLLGDIENAELRQALAEWPSVVRNTQEDEELARDFLPNVLVPSLMGQGLIEKAYEYQAAFYGRNRSGKDPEWVQVTVRPELIELVTVRIAHAALAAGSVRYLAHRRLARVIDLLGRELEDRGIDRPVAAEESVDEPWTIEEP